MLTIFLLVGCATAGNHISAAPSGIAVKENKVYVEGVLYAELVLIYPWNNKCRGLAIHYMPTNSYAWISPQGGLQLQDRHTEKIIEDIPTIVKQWDQFEPGYRIMKNFKSAGGDGFFKLDWRSDIKISDDGLHVTYTEQTETSLFGATKKTYQILY